MIILDEEDQQRSKELNDPFNAGPTLRFPEKAALRSESPLPDYETSEARQKLIARARSSRKVVDPRLWRAILIAFGIYVLLSIVIGVPIILVKRQQQEDTAINFGPPSWANDPDTGTAISISGANVWALEDTAKCEWDYIGSYGPSSFSANIQHTLNFSGSFYIRSNVSTITANSSYSNGHLIVDINPDKSATKIVFKVDAYASTEELLRQTSACFVDSGNNRGLSVFVSRPLRNSDFVRFNIEILLPSNKKRTNILENFVTYLPWFSHSFGDLENHLLFKNLIIEGAGLPVNAKSLKGSKLSVKNAYADIIGSYHATTSLSLDGIKGDIDANVTLEHLSTAISPTTLSLDTGDGGIDARITLVAPSTRPPPHNSPYIFVADIRTFNGPLNIRATNEKTTPPTPLQFTLQNPDGDTNLILDQNYEGTYNVQSKLGKVSVRKPYFPPSMDPLGQRRSRAYQTEQQGSNQVYGWVGWGRRPMYGDGVIQGQVKVTTSLSPILLQLGSASDS
ncbi:hypothetical protein DXG03_003226 [Asterophora parasitica]|uniref:DUF4097 domain-containing protein n=1 Tax=Asterophora parasitica TaxID=117018 RepID=A0A9P7KHA3_9AGAR|nr:hypothetical protein DXG03_003226 [Asterophora parasitica]